MAWLLLVGIALFALPLLSRLRRLSLDRRTIAWLAGAAAIAVGLGLVFGAESLATHWESLGPGAWGGTTDPSLESAYRLTGYAVLCFGLVLETLAFWRWLGQGSRERAW
jgi:hypothetical protein